MPSRRFKNPLHRILFRLGHTPAELIEGIAFLLIGWVFWLSLTGAGGFIEFGKPMIGISYALLCLTVIHGIIVLFRKSSRGVGWEVLLPLPFLLLSLTHFLYLSPFPWSTALVLVAYLEAYALFVIILNSIRGPKSALWMLLSCEFIVIAAVLVAFRQFYLNPGGWMLSGRIRYPEYAHGMAGYLQDPHTLAALILLIWPLTVMISWMRRFPAPVRVANLFCVITFPIALLLSASRWGLVVFLLQFLAMPIFLTGERWLRRQLWGYGLGLLALVVSVFWYTADGLQQRIRFLLSETHDVVEGGLRTAWLQFTDAPISGQGLGTFGSLWDRFSLHWGMGSSLSSGSHILDLMAGTGLLGLILLLVPLLIIFYRAMVTWRAQPHIIYDQDMIRRLKHLPSRKRFRTKLAREGSQTSSRKVFLGGLFPGVIGLLLYQLTDYSLRLPLHLFLFTCLVSGMIVIGSGYQFAPASGLRNKILALVPLGLAVICCLYGVPRFSAQHLVYTANEKLQWLQENPERIFLYPENLDSIESDFTRACDLDPQHAGAWIGLSQCFLARVDEEKEAPEEIARKALVPLQEALSLSPLSWEVHYSMARVGIMLGKQMDEVQEGLERAHELAPCRPEPEALLGILLLMENRQSGKGHALVEHALEKFPDYPEVHLFLPWLGLSPDNNKATGLDGSMVTPGYVARQFAKLPETNEQIRGAGLPARYN